jgi:hypothetical protein
VKSQRRTTDAYPWQKLTGLPGELKRWKCEILIGKRFTSLVQDHPMIIPAKSFWLVEILKIFLLETTKPNELWLCRNDHWVVLY